MRAGIGLLSLLIGVAIIFYLSFGGKNGGYEGTAMKAGKDAREQASQISGRTEDNVPIAETFKLDEVDDSNHQFRRLKVVSITVGTPMDTVYGLKANDEITRVGDMGVSDNNDAGLAKALVAEAYQNNQPLTVLRDGNEMKLTPSSSPLTKFHGNLFNSPNPQQIPMH